MVLWGAFHSAVYQTTLASLITRALFCTALLAAGSAGEAATALPRAAGLSFRLSEVQPNSSLNLNPSLISEVTAGAKNKNAAGVGPSVDRAERTVTSAWGSGPEQFPVTPEQLESGRGQTAPRAWL